MTTSLNVELHGEDQRVGSLAISSLPRSRDEGDVDSGAGGAILREGHVYRYEFAVGGPISEVQPAELFDPDDESARTGRFRPRETVGLITVQVTQADGVTLQGRFDVRSAKFGDEGAFATMLADLAARSVESLHQGFAPGAGQFGRGAPAEPRLLYQRFAVLSSLLEGSDLRWAISLVLSRPHREWTSELEARPPGRPLRGSSRLVHQLSRPGPRVPAPSVPTASLPASLLVQRTEETLDTIPNRFVRFVFERWRALAFSVAESASSLTGAPQLRGLQQANDVVDQLDEVLGDPLFREVGRLTVMPSGNQVLGRREGYRQIAGAAALVDASLGLDVDLEDPFLVSRRSVATLYEYWAFVCLAEAVARACGSPGLTNDLFKPSPTGMSLVLKAGATSRMKFKATVGSQTVLADLFFNREFRSDSWTRPMRPDASLVVRRPGDREVWLHFDAKYKVDWDSPFITGEPDDEEAAERTGASKRTDLLKMHAYRDAIRGSAGSYVLFPGSEVAEFSVNTTEFLPGLGAFPLRPENADADTTNLESFVQRVIRHVAGPGTRHRRATYWEALAYAGDGTDAPDASPPVADLPPADTRVLVGYVRSEAQWEWIRSSGLYNVRSGDRPGALTLGGPELDAPLLLLYGPGKERGDLALYGRNGPWEGLTVESMRKLGYPHPRGEAYLATRVEPLASPVWLEAVEVQSLAPAAAVFGQPFSVSWLDLVLATQNDLDSPAHSMPISPPLSTRWS